LVSESVLAALSDTNTPQGVVAVCHQFDVTLDDVIASKPKLVALLSQIRDPGNAGTVLRAADAAGADAVIFSSGSVDIYNPKVGSSSVVFAKPGVKVIASDFSEGMLSVGRKRHPQLEFVFADATALPFKDASVDAVTISFGLRNVVDPKKALSEMLRVLKPNGVVVICEFSHLSTPVVGALYRFYLKSILPTLSKAVTRNKGAYNYLAESIAAWPKQEVLVDWLVEAGFSNAKYKNLSLGIVAIHTAQKVAK